MNQITVTKAQLEALISEHNATIIEGNLKNRHDKNTCPCCSFANSLKPDAEKMVFDLMYDMLRFVNPGVIAMAEMAKLTGIPMLAEGAMAEQANAIKTMMLLFAFGIQIGRNQVVEEQMKARGFTE